MNLQEGAAIILMLLRVYPTVTIPEGTEILWAEKFRDFEFEIVVKAIDEWTDEEQFWPAISEIKDLIRRQRERQPTPYLPLPSGQGARKITQKVWTQEELDKMRTDRRFILDGLKAGKTWQELVIELGRTPEEFNA